MKKFRYVAIAILAGLLFAVPAAADADRWAVEVVDYGNLLEFDYYNNPYDPNAVLGTPTIDTGWGYLTSMTNPPWQSGHIVPFTEGGYITVKFASPVTSFTIFGNSMFDAYFSGGYIEDIFGHEHTVSVSKDNETWYTFTNFAGTYWPTQAFAAWDNISEDWDTNSPSDFFLPMNPDLTMDDFLDLHIFDALALYDGSAGGSHFDVSALGLNWIQYVRVEGDSGGIDAFAAVNVVPAPPSIILLALGIAGVAARKKLRR